MIPKKALDLAFKGGWEHEKRQYYYWQMTTCDPTFWIALGKQLGWHQGTEYEWDEGTEKYWKAEASRFFYAVMSGDSTEAFWKEIIG